MNRALAFLLLIVGTTPAAALGDDVPEGFVRQILEPTGGKILRPANWYYAERHRNVAWDWILSKEDTHGGKDSYETGVRIQLFPGLKKGSGKAPSIFLGEFIQGKQQAADYVHRIDGPYTEGLFTRQCLEVDEGPYRIHYSVFWNDRSDIGVVYIAGTPKAEWEAHEAIFNRMHTFEIIDMSRFEDEGTLKIKN